MLAERCVRAGRSIEKDLVLPRHLRVRSINHQSGGAVDLIVAGEKLRPNPTPYSKKIAQITLRGFNLHMVEVLLENILILPGPPAI